MYMRRIARVCVCEFRVVFIVGKIYISLKFVYIQMHARHIHIYTCARMGAGGLSLGGMNCMRQTKNVLGVVFPRRTPTSFL